LHILSLLKRLREVADAADYIHISVYGKRYGGLFRGVSVPVWSHTRGEEGLTMKQKVNHGWLLMT
jgi:hypothetical protein